MSPATPERQLAGLALLRSQMDALAVTAIQPAAAQSFGLFSNPFASAEQTVSELLTSIQEILAQLTPTTQIQTSREGFTAITVLNYSGSFTSLWSATPPPSAARAHLASLQGTLDLRHAVAGVIAAAGAALTAISLALSNPLTAGSALQSAIALKNRIEALSQLISAQLESQGPA